MRVADLKQELHEKHNIENSRIQKTLKAELVKMVSEERAKIQKRYSLGYADDTSQISEVAKSKPSTKKRKFHELTNYKTLDENKASIEK